MGSKKWYIIVFLVSVIGLAVIQIQYLRIGLNLAKVQFNEKVGLAIQQIKLGLSDQNELTFLAGRAITKDSSYFKLSLDSVQDASRYFMSDFIQEELLKQGIKSEFSFQIFDRDSIIYLHSPNMLVDEDDLLKYAFEVKGYLPKVAEKRLLMQIRFNDLNNYFLFQLNGLTIPGLLFLVAIIFVVLWVLKSFYWQRNLIIITNEFINNLTHELKTPIFSIRIATKILNERSGEEDKKIINIIRDQTDKLKHQIDKILELSTLEGKKNIFRKKSIDFKPELEKLCASFKEISLLEEVSFTCTLEGDHYIILAESSHLENAVNSVLENARKYSRPPAKINLQSFVKESFLYIEISDNGIGIEKKDVHQIFQKFYRASTGDLHDVKGYGLGLNYVQQVLKNHNGKISVQSEPGKGSTFTMKIPVYNNGK